MKVTAYIADCCGELMKGKDVVGLSLQADLIDKLESFKTIPSPDKADAHYCVKCYTKYVTDVVRQLTNGDRTHPDYQYYIKVHAHSFKTMVISHYNAKK